MRHLAFPSLPVLPAFLVLGGLAAATPAAAQQLTIGAGRILCDARTPIASVPFRIEEPGSYYLVDNLFGVPGEAGITIAADDVGLDLNGFTMFGDPASGAAILFEGTRSRASVRNGRLVSWLNGVDGAGASDVRVSHVDAAGNVDHGIVLGFRGVVEDCATTGNGIAGVVVGGRSVVRRVIADGHGENGIRTGDAGLVEDCVGRASGAAGIFAGPLTIVRNCRAELNTGFGIFSEEAGQVVDSYAYQNGAAGIRGGGRTLVRGCTSLENTLRGIELQDASMAVSCVVNGNGQAGIFVNAFGIVRDNISHSNFNGIVSQLGLVRDNVTIGSTENGILSNDADYVRGNFTLRNGLTGIRSELDNARIAENHVIENATGIRALSAFTTIHKNSLVENGQDFVVGVDTDQANEIRSADDDAWGNIVPAATPIAND